MKLDEVRVRHSLQHWVRTSLLPYLREGGASSDVMARQLVQELADLSRVDEHGRVFAPDQYTFSIHPGAGVGIREDLPDLQAALSKSLEQTLVELGFSLPRRIHVSLATDPTLGEAEAKVIAWHSGDPLKVTKELTPVSSSEAGMAPEGAFLMVEGKRHFYLENLEITVGRLLENDLVLDNPHVSRRHAILRLEKGRYVLYDRESTAGTMVNGVVVRSHSLVPGDVVTMATVEMVYGEDAGGPPSAAPPYSPPQQPSDEAQRVTPLDLRKVEVPTQRFTRGEEDTEPEEDPD